jgi:hypothetical protein
MTYTTLGFEETMTCNYGKHSFLVRLENLKRGDHSEDVRLDGRIILGWEAVDWINLAKDRDQEPG